jgi:hypothetical protein
MIANHLEARIRAGKPLFGALMNSAISWRR